MAKEWIGWSIVKNDKDGDDKKCFWSSTKFPIKNLKNALKSILFQSLQQKNKIHSAAEANNIKITIFYK